MALSLSQNFRVEPANCSDIVQTSIGPIGLAFTDTEPDSPPCVNVVCGAIWFEKARGLRREKGRLSVEMHQTLAFEEGKWYFQGAPKYRVDNVETEIPADVQREIADLVGDWASKNQERFVEHERALFFDWVRIAAEMLSDCDGQLPNEEVKECFEAIQSEEEGPR